MLKYQYTRDICITMFQNNLTFLMKIVGNSLHQTFFLYIEIDKLHKFNSIIRTPYCVVFVFS